MKFCGPWFQFGTILEHVLCPLSSGTTGTVLLRKGNIGWALSVGFTVLSWFFFVSCCFFVTVGGQVIGSPQNMLLGGLFELLLCCSLKFLILAVQLVHSTQ